MDQNKAVYERKKLSNLKMHNQLLKIAIVLQVMHFPMFLGSIEIFIYRHFRNSLSLSIAKFFSIFTAHGAIIYIFRWYYWGVVIIEAAVLLIFLIKTGDVLNTIKKEKKKYISLLILLICNLITVIFYYDSFWHGVTG